MDMKCELMLEEFREKQADLAIIRDIAVHEIERIVRERNMLVNAVDSRVKSEKSLAGKLELKGYKYKKLADITDLVGVRVVTFYEDEIDLVAEDVAAIFDVDWENSVDKRKLLDTDRFGYLSLHYICRIPENLYADPEHPAVNELRFEIQMRTTLQHVWATVFHDTGYKSDIEVPATYIRKLNRLAGLLEVADSEFHDLRDEIEAYRERMRALIVERRFDDVKLDGDSWTMYLGTSPFSELTERIAETSGVEIVGSQMRNFLQLLKNMGFTTIGQIERAKTELADDVVEYTQATIEANELDIMAESAVLRHLLIVYVYRQGWGIEGLMRYYLEVSGNGDIERARRHAQRTFKQLEALFGSDAAAAE